MYGDPISAELLFAPLTDHLTRRCYVRMTGLTNTGVATYLHGSLQSEEHPQNATINSPTVMTGQCMAVFSDRKYEIPLVPPGSDLEIVNGFQTFSAREVDTIYLSIKGSSPIAGTGYAATLRFGSPNGERMTVPVALQGNFLIGTTPLKQNRQTTFTFAFVEGDPYIPG